MRATIYENVPISETMNDSDVTSKLSMANMFNVHVHHGNFTKQMKITQ